MNVVMFSKYKVIAQVLGVVGPVLIFIHMYHILKIATKSRTLDPPPRPYMKNNII